MGVTAWFRCLARCEYGGSIVAYECDAIRVPAQMVRRMMPRSLNQQWPTRMKANRLVDPDGSGNRPICTAALHTGPPATWG